MNDKIGFEIVLPTDDNLRLIMGWRNDPESLKMSFHSTPKTWDSFRSGFLKRFFHIQPLYILSEGHRAGFIGLELYPESDSRSCEISIQIAPEFRGRGIATEALKAIQLLLKAQGFHSLHGDVKVENIPSQKAFEAAGFIREAAFEKRIEDLDQTFSIIHYKAVLNQNPSKVFVIAEAGSNWRAGSHDNDLTTALALIDAAADAEADAVKFQTFSPESIYVANAGSSGYLEQSGIDQEMQALFKDLAMPHEMIPKLAAHCKKRGIEFMSTPFSPEDFAAVDPFVKRHKIASYEIGHIHLLKLAAQSGKPLILSTGAATAEEIAWAVDTFREFGGKDLTLLQCTAAYPAPAPTMHLNTIPYLKQHFGVPVGLSDHSLHPFGAALTAVALGASVIEKHFTLDRSLPGPDHAFAITPDELKELVKSVHEAKLMLGSHVKIVDFVEDELRKFARRGIQVIQPIQKGESFKEGKNIAILRPGKQPLGVHPRFINEIDGKIAKRSLNLGEGIQKGDW